jgi:uncharacterized protein YfaS (alpha-2-macroglobulin family)
MIRSTAKRLFLLWMVCLFLSGCAGPSPTRTPDGSLIRTPISPAPTPAQALLSPLLMPTPLAVKSPLPVPTPVPAAQPAVPVVMDLLVLDEQGVRATPGALGVRRPTIRLRFNQAMDHDSVLAALHVTPYLPLSLAWQDEVLALSSPRPLAPGARYLFALDETAKSREGVPMVDDYHWNIRTEPVVSFFSSPAPPDWRRPIALSFSYAMDTASVQRALRIEPPFAGGVSWNRAGTVLTLIPTTTLPGSIEYTLSFDRPLLDASGDQLSVPGPFHFVSPPPILAALPTGSRVSPSAAIEVVFDRPMDEGVTAKALQIQPEVAGRVTWSETTLVFEVEGGYLAEDTDYQVTVGPQALAADGQPILEEAYTWTFRTGSLPDAVQFGWGPNAQVLDVDGRRAIQLWLSQANQSDAVFELYALNLEQFLDRYASGFRGVAGSEHRPISTEGTTLTRRWVPEPDLWPDDHQGPAEIFVPSDVPAGLYVLNAEAGHLNDQLLLLLTRNTMVVKQAEGQIVAWVTDINGGPVPDIWVAVYARDGEQISEGRTDAHGIYRTEVAIDPQPLIVVARAGDDVTASGLSNEWRSPEGSWWRWWRPSPEAQDYAVHLYTDRPIYRPGQTVFFKAILRSDDDAVLDVLPAGTPVQARIRDARDNVVQTYPLSTNEFGTVYGAFDLAEGAMLGNYVVEVVVGDEPHRQVFKVEDYRKPDYKVTIVTGSDRVVAGQMVEGRVESAYYIGQPVADAEIKLNLFRLGEPYWWDGGSDQEYTWYPRSKPLATGRTDADGRFTFAWQAAIVDQGSQPYWYSSQKRQIWGIEATVDDGSNQPVSGFAVIQVFDAAEQIDVDAHGYLHEPGQPFAIDARVTTILDEPVAGRALDITLRRWTPEKGDYKTVVRSAHSVTGADGHARTFLTIDEPGYYQLDVSAVDWLGRDVDWYTYVYAFGGSSALWYGGDSALSISADRETYAPGDTARLLIESRLSGPALLTIERGTTRREQLVELEAPVTTVEVPVLPDDVPNIYVAVHVWEEQDAPNPDERYASQADSRLHHASTNLSVPAADKRLAVAIAPDKESYAPRERATFVVRVTDHLGQPVEAEVSLAMVDEAIFSLSAELSGPILDSFYGEREDIVRTYDALALTRYLAGGGMGGGGGDLAGSPRIDFPDTARWLPAVRTGANGEATVAIDLPDSLTSWRLTAVAVTADTKVGEAYVNVVTQQEIVVRPILPRSLTAGDEVLLSAFVHNYGPGRRSIDVSIGQEGEPSLRIAGSITQTIDLEPGGQRLVGWSATAANAGEAQLVVRASGPDTAGDAVALTIPVQPLAMPNVQTEVGQFVGEQTVPIFVPPEALPMGSIHVELSRSIAGTLLEGLEYLTGFPFGCVEQTMSKALPNAVVGRALYLLGVGNPTLQADLPAKINASLQRLYGFQHNDGGWGWWYDDSTDAYQTAWVVFGLTVVAEAGYEVDPVVIERGVSWLDGHLAGMDVRTRAYALYSMAVAGHPDPAETLALAGRLDELDTFGRAGVALALHEAGETAAAERVVEYLARTATVRGPEVFWGEAMEDGHYAQKTMASSTRSTALALSALVRIAPDHELVPGVVHWLMGQRRQSGWGSTNETSYAILALTDHLLATSYADSATDTGYALSLNGSPVADGWLGRGEPAVTLDIPIGQAQIGTNELHIAQTGSGQLYYVVSRRAYLPRKRVEATGEIGIRRTYLDPKTQQPVEVVAAGQLVEVRLEVTLLKEGSYILIEDRLPGGLEAINERLNTTSHVAAMGDSPRYYWNEYGYNHKEVHSDRVCFFITEASTGIHTLTYLARAAHAGRFAALPAEASAMYDLLFWGRSASDALIVRRAGGASSQQDIVW